MIVRCYSNFINLNPESVARSLPSQMYPETIRKFLSLFSELFSPYFVFNPQSRNAVSGPSNREQKFVVLRANNC